jgi:hypothetical protein
MGDCSSFFFKKRRLKKSATFWFSELGDAWSNEDCVDAVQKAK